MTRFSAEKNNLTAVEWSELAIKNLQENSSQFSLFAGLGVAACLGASASPITGVLVAGYFFTHHISKAKKRQENIAAIIENGCVAQVLDDNQFKRYLNQFGHDAVMDELTHAQNHGLEFSNDALDYFEDSTVSVLPAPDAPSKQPPLTRLASKLFPQNTTVSQAEKYDPTSRIDIINEMSSRINNSIIIGIPGSGKGVLISNAIIAAKKKDPSLKVFVIDPKNDPKEAGYFACCDAVKRLSCMDAKPGKVAVWAEAMFSEYSEYAQKNDQTLLIVDEGTLLGNKLALAKSSLLIDKLTAYTSGGDSSGRNVWFMMQSPYVGSAGLNLSTSSQMTTIVIGFSENIGALIQWKSAKLFKALNIDAVSEIINNSSTGRAIYYGKNGEWYEMPELKNYSGYDRDKREYLEGFEPQLDNPTSDIDAVTQLENSFNQPLEVDDIQDNQVVSDVLLGQILELITNSTTSPVSFNSIRVSKAWNRDYDTSNPGRKILRDALTKLVADKKLTGNEDDGYSLANIN
jgi:hypothetical protein